MSGPLARLPPPRVEQWDWQRTAACRRTNDAVFVAPAGERGAPRQQSEDAAKEVEHRRGRTDHRRTTAEAAARSDRGGADRRDIPAYLVRDAHVLTYTSNLR